MTGTLGGALAKLHHARGDTVFGCARSEEGACRWHRDRADVGTLFVCDVESIAYHGNDLSRVLPTVQRVYHCAAMKHVDLCEEGPDEAAFQNVRNTSLVAHACDKFGVPLVFASTDKACMPQGVYGATKLIAERTVTRLGGAAVRLGNLVGSSGSVFARWKESLARGEKIKLTDPEMTRYFMGVVEAANFMADESVPGKVVIPHPLKAARMGDVANALAGPGVDVIGPRPGETRHQWLVAPGEKVTRHGRKIVFGGESSPDHVGHCGDGLHSGTSERWAVNDLLSLAGVRAF